MQLVAGDLGWWILAAALAAGAGLYLWRLNPSALGRANPGDFVTVDEVRQMLAGGESVLMADVRSESSYGASATTASGAIRIHPARAVDEARLQNLPTSAAVVTFCA